MEYRYIKASELESFAIQFADSTSPVLPITPWRARSQSENPDVRPGDTLLIAAIGDTGRIIGYIGLLPGQLQNKQGRRIFWNTCWWTAPDAGAGVSLNLFSRFLKETGNMVAFSDLTEKTVKIIRSLGGYRVSKREGIVLRIRHAYHSRILISKKSPPALRFIAATGVFRVTDSILNLARNNDIKRWLKDHPATCDASWQDEPGEQHLQFASQHADTAAVTPTSEKYRWWKNYPWLIQPGKRTRRIANRYYFSSISLTNELLMLDCSSDDSLAGFAIISNRDGVLKTHFLYYRQELEQEFFQSLFSNMVSLPGAHSLVSFHEDFAKFVAGQRIPAVQNVTVTRYTAVSEELESVIGTSLYLQDGDGDYIFT